MLRHEIKLAMNALFLIAAIISCAFSIAQAYDIEAPIYLYTSGSARLVGMGDASVAIIDATGYNTNPATLALQSDAITASFSLGGVSRFASGYGSAYVSLGKIPLWGMSGRWSCGISVVSQTIADRYSYLKSGKPDTDQNISGIVYGGTEFNKPLSIPKESFRSLAIGLGHRGRTQIGIGLAARNVRLYASRLDQGYAQNQFVDGWNFDIGVISRWNIEAFSSQSISNRRSFVISPSFGFKCLGIYRTNVSKEYLTDLLSDFLVTREPMYGGPPGNVYAGDQTIHTGAALTVAMNESNLAHTAITMAIEIQGGGSAVAHGSKVGAELNVFETASIRVGHGVYGDQYDISTWGCSVSSTGLQKMLHHKSTYEIDGSKGPLLSRLHITISYANNKHLRSTTIPDDYWTLTLSI